MNFKGEIPYFKNPHYKSDKPSIGEMKVEHRKLNIVLQQNRKESMWR